MPQKANPYVQVCFNYSSIVEICIDKGLSGGDLCGCQLSPPKPTGSIGTQNPAAEGPFWGPDMILQQHVEQKRKVSRLGKTSSSGGIDGTGWPLTWGRAEERAEGHLL